MSEEWSLPERHLVAELAVGLARRLQSILGGRDNVDPETGYLWHMAGSDFENGCNVLWRLEVALAAYGPTLDRKDLTFSAGDLGKGWPSHFKFLNEAAIKAKLLVERQESAPTLNEVLAAYLSVACNYGGSDDAILPSGRSPFSPHHQYAREIDALENLQYLERVGDVVVWGTSVAHDAVWTDNIAPTMQAAHLWDSNGQSFADLAKDSLASEVKRELARTPDLTRRTLSNEAMRSSELDFGILLRDRFDGLYWSKNADGSPRASRGDVRLVKAIYDALKRES